MDVSKYIERRGGKVYIWLDELIKIYTKPILTFNTLYRWKQKVHIL